VNRSGTILAAGFVSLFLASPGFAQEKKLNKSDLPAAVQKAVDEQSQGATVRGFSTEKENGQTIYEAQLTVNGKNRDISFDPKGSVLEVEDEVAFESLPAPVQDGLKKKAGAGKITRVETLTKKGKVVAYEAVVQNGAKKSEIQVGPDGKPLAHEE
jgi:uncharacterized membrane protein YkoI